MQDGDLRHYPDKEPCQPVVKASSHGADAGNHTEGTPEAVQRSCQYINEHSSRNHEHLSQQSTLQLLVVQAPATVDSALCQGDQHGRGYRIAFDFGMLPLSRHQRSQVRQG